MKEKIKITDYLLDLYHLKAVSNKERKLIEEALKNDSEVKARYDTMLKEEQEIRNSEAFKRKLFTVIKNDNISETKIISRNRKMLIGIGVAAVLLCISIPSFIYLSGKTTNKTFEMAAETKTEPKKDDNPIINPDYENIEEPTKIELVIENNKTITESENTFIAVVPNTEQGVYFRGETNTEPKPPETTEQNTISIPEGITFIFDSMYANRGLTSITIPERITFISNNAFANNQITNVIIPVSVTSIGSGAFSNNPLISVTIGANVYIDDNAIPGNFAYLYNSNGKTSGTYTRTNTAINEWIKK